MRLVIATCSVDYAGRLSSHLPSAMRLLLVKADGSVSIHADDRAYKPLNWMSPPCTLTETHDEDTITWTVVNKAAEQLVITMTEVHHDSSHELGLDPGLVKDGVEAHLQELLAANLEPLGDGLRLVQREFPTPIGPVDIVCRAVDGGTVAATCVLARAMRFAVRLGASGARQRFANFENFVDWAFDLDVSFDEGLAEFV